MFATDFIFNGKRASSFGLFIGGVDGGDTVTSGGELSLNSVRAPGSDIFVHYSSAFDSPLEFTIPVIKWNCEDVNDVYFDQYEESAIAKWLLQRKGYQWLQFDQEGYEDIYYKVMCTSLTPEQVGGKTIGFNITFTSNCAYGFSREKKQTLTINSSKPASLSIRSDVDSYIEPYFEIIGNGSYFISNDSDEMQKYKKTELKNINYTVIMDSENGIIKYKDNDSFTADKFNFYFLRLLDGINTFTTTSNSDIRLEITYREPRRVLI